MVKPTPYPDPQRIWVDDGHVLVTAHDGTTVVMTPEVAIAMGRRLSELGTDALINKVMDPPTAA